MGLVVLAAGALAGCGGESEGGAKASPTATSEVMLRPDLEEWERVPAKDQQAFLTYMGKIDKGLAGNEAQRKRTMRRAVYTCIDLGKGTSREKLAKLVSYRYTGGQATVSVAEAKRVISATRKWICPALK
jgi:hypothetical protein